MRHHRGGFINSSLPIFSTSSASGVFTINDAAILKANTQWPRGPVAPTGLTASAGNAQLSLSWTAPTTTYGTITNYLVEYTASGGSAQYVLTNSTSTSYTLTGLTNGTAYSLRVAAVNFTAGDWSGTATGTPATLSLFSIEYLVVGGGGGAGGNFGLWGGGGGAGGYRTGTITSHSLLTATNVTVGNGGQGGLDHIEWNEDYGIDAQQLTYATNGSNSSLGNIVSLGGGAGANGYVRFGLYPLNNASSGGSGGGGGGTSYSGYVSGGGAGTSGQGFAGSNGSYFNEVGGGGGAGGAGGAGGDNAAIGGPGVSNSITGVSVVYAAGGSDTANALASAQNENTGNGGTTRGGEVRGADPVKRGKKGVVILAYPSSNPAINSIGAGLTYTVSTTSRTGYRVYIFTNGSGNIQFT